MKKVILILAAMVITGGVLTSCSSVKSCPAYGKASKPATERPC